MKNGSYLWRFTREKNHHEDGEIIHGWNEFYKRVMVKQWLHYVDLFFSWYESWIIHDPMIQYYSIDLMAVKILGYPPAGQRWQQEQVPWLFPV